jgi:hypothetical protein
MENAQLSCIVHTYKPTYLEYPSKTGYWIWNDLVSIRCFLFLGPAESGIGLTSPAVGPIVDTRFNTRKGSDVAGQQIVQQWYS